MEFLKAFLVGGAICAIAQIMMDLFRMTPAHTMTTMVVIGAILGSLGLYDPIIEFSGAGATTPISSFGNSLYKSAMKGAEAKGIVGIFTGIYEKTAGGISAALIFGFITSLIFKPKG